VESTSSNIQVQQTVQGGAVFFTCPRNSEDTSSIFGIQWTRAGRTTV
ncbi:hypothetical protein T265_02858, partial [Opisthorchis viverrini]